MGPHTYQTEDWIQERVQQLRESTPSGCLKDHVTHLWKHQAFEAEVQAHEQVMTSVAKVTHRPDLPQRVGPWMAKEHHLRQEEGHRKAPLCPISQQGEAILVQNYPQAREVFQRLQALQELWEKLRQAVTLRGQVLKDKSCFLEFLQRVDLAEAWIRQKVEAHLGRAGWGLGAKGWGREESRPVLGGSLDGKFQSSHLPRCCPNSKGQRAWHLRPVLSVLPSLPGPSQEVMVNISDQGQDHEHCLRLYRQLRKFQSTMVAGVRGPAQEGLAQHPVWEIWPRVSSDRAWAPGPGVGRALALC